MSSQSPSDLVGGSKPQSKGKKLKEKLRKPKKKKKSKSKPKDRAVALTGTDTDASKRARGQIGALLHGGHGQRTERTFDEVARANGHEDASSVSNSALLAMLGKDYEEEMKDRRPGQSVAAPHPRSLTERQREGGVAPVKDATGYMSRAVIDAEKGVFLPTTAEAIRKELATMPTFSGYKGETTGYMARDVLSEASVVNSHRNLAMANEYMQGQMAKLQDAMQAAEETASLPAGEENDQKRSAAMQACRLAFNKLQEAQMKTQYLTTQLALQLSTHVLRQGKGFSATTHDPVKDAITQMYGGDLEIDLGMSPAELGLPSPEQRRALPGRAQQQVERAPAASFEDYWGGYAPPPGHLDD